jgi:hypothetical protein
LCCIEKPVSINILTSATLQETLSTTLGVVEQILTFRPARLTYSYSEIAPLPLHNSRCPKCIKVPKLAKLKKSGEEVVLSLAAVVLVLGDRELI